MGASAGHDQATQPGKPGSAAPAHKYGPDGMPLSEGSTSSREDLLPLYQGIGEQYRLQYLRGELEEFEVLDPGLVFAGSLATGTICRVQADDWSKVPAESAGVLYRRSKALEDLRDDEVLAEWGSTVAGVDEGDGWLRVESCGYLPLAVGGTRVLARLEARDYIVDNSQLKASAAGLAYRFSRSLEDKDTRVGAAGGPAFGSVVRGVDLGDGWVQVGERFLPVMLNGAQVLVARNEESNCVACGARLRTGGACLECGARPAGIVEESAGGEAVERELEELYKELYRRMGAGGASGDALSSGILDFPLAQG